MEGFVIDVYTIIGFGAVLQMAVLTTLCLTGKWEAKRVLLGLLFLFFGLSVLHDTLAHSHLMLKWTALFGMGPLFVIGIGPLLFLYLQSVLHSKFKFKLVHLLHFAPLIIALISRSDQLLAPTSWKVERLTQIFASAPLPRQGGQITIDLWHFALWHLQPLVYYAISLGLIFKNDLARSHANKHTFRWLQVLLIGFIILFITDYASEISLLPWKIRLGSTSVYFILSSIFVYGLCFILLKVPEIPFRQLIRSLDRNSHEKINDVFGHVSQLMTEEKPFLDHTLQLQSFARLVQRDINLVSKSINQRAGKNFNDFINGFRIRHAQKLLQDVAFDHLTIEAIGKESGFNSKDAFYRAFKKETGLTPAKFKNNRSI